MRASLVSVAFLLLTVVIPVCGDDIKTLDGKTYYNVKVISKTPTTMTVECSRTADTEDKMITTINSHRLNEDTQKKYELANKRPNLPNQEIITTANSSSVKKNNIETPTENTCFDVQQGASTQQYLIQKTKLSKIQDLTNARTRAEMKEMDDNAN